MMIGAERNLEVVVAEDEKTLCRKAIRHMAAICGHVLKKQKEITIALAGGSTPLGLYALMARPPYRGRLQWSRIHFFWGDERCVPPDDSNSNYRAAADAFLGRIDIPNENIHFLDMNGRSPGASARLYEKEITSHFRLKRGRIPRFDLILLGLGSDGHTASLFPNTAALVETSRFVTVTQGGKPYLPRVTLTLPVLNHAKHLMWIVAGARKAAAVRDVLEKAGKKAELLPAQRVQLINGKTTWFLDRPAARFLQRLRSKSGFSYNS